MHRLGTITFSGNSGASYKFDVYPIDSAFDPSVSGVYMVTKRKAGRTGFVHKRIHLGQSEDLCQSRANGERSFSSRGGNCFCVHVQPDAQQRLDIETDLIRQRPAQAD